MSKRFERRNGAMWLSYCIGFFAKVDEDLPKGEQQFLQLLRSINHGDKR